MCVLIISNYFGTVDRGRLTEIASQIGHLTDRARLEQRPIAFVQRDGGIGLSGLGVRIGRYEPIYTMRSAQDHLPKGLIEFVVRNPVRAIDLAGIAAIQQFDRLQTILSRSGYPAEINVKASILIESDSEAPGAKRIFQNQ